MLPEKTYKIRTRIAVVIFLLVNITAGYHYWTLVSGSISSNVLALCSALLFQLLFANICYMVLCCMACLFIKEEPLLEQHSDVFPETAVLYVVKNEENEFWKNIAYTFKNNSNAPVDYWLVSSSREVYYRNLEKRYCDEFKIMTGEYLHLYRSFRSELGRKHIALKDWVVNHDHYEYVLVCDVDTRIPEGVVKHLVQMAIHPANQKIGIFQTHLAIDRSPTWFSTLLKNAQNIGQRLYAGAMDRILGRTAFWGSGALIRTSLLKQMNVPEIALSHDIWDTVQTDKLEYTIRYISSVTTYESFPDNYLDFLRREKRWMKGSMQAIHLAFDRQISFASRFYVLYPIYCYLAQPILLAYILCGFFIETSGNSMIIAPLKYTLAGTGLLQLESGGFFLFVIGVLIIHRAPVVKSFKEAGLLLTEIAFSTVLLLNNVFYTTLVLFQLPFTAYTWDPKLRQTKKSNCLTPYVMKFFPVTIIGIILFGIGMTQAHFWLIAAFPFVMSFMFSIPTAWLSSFRRY